jgi:hypothetical protein
MDGQENEPGSIALIALASLRQSRGTGARDRYATPPSLKPQSPNLFHRYVSAEKCSKPPRCCWRGVALLRRLLFRRVQSGHLQQREVFVHFFDQGIESLLASLAAPGRGGS